MDDPLTIPALRALRRILRASDLSSRQLATTTGLTPSQLLLMQEIVDRGASTPTQLAASLRFSQATVTNICDRLEKAGLVARNRDVDDRRRIHLTATEAGKAVAEAAPNLLQTRFVENYAALPQWEQAMILAGLEKLAEVLGVAASDAAPLLDAGAIAR